MNKRKTRCSANTCHFIGQKHDRWSPSERREVRPGEWGYKRVRLMILSLSAPKAQGLDSFPSVILPWHCSQHRYMILHSSNTKGVIITAEETEETRELWTLVVIYSLIYFIFLREFWTIMLTGLWQCLTLGTLKI